MVKYLPYDPSNPVAVADEQHTVANAKIRLRHVPAEGSIQISGFTEKSSPAGLQFNEFYCRYAKDTLYRDANRIVYFSSLRNGSTVTVNYSAVGTVLTADDMNEIKAHIENSEEQFVNMQFALNQLSNDILALRNLIASIDTSGGADITTHDQSHDSHQFIQGLILTEESARQSADNFLGTRIANETAVRQAVDTDLQNQINQLGDVDAHNQSPTAHADIRELIQTEQSARASADSNLQTQINGKMTFAGTSTAFPSNPQAGWLAIVNDSPYLFNGSQWTLLVSDGQFLLGTESSTVEGAMWLTV